MSVWKSILCTSSELILYFLLNLQQAKEEFFSVCFKANLDVLHFIPPHWIPAMQKMFLLRRPRIKKKIKNFKIPQKALDIFQMDKLTDLPKEENG